MRKLFVALLACFAVLGATASAGEKKQMVVGYINIADTDFFQKQKKDAFTRIVSKDDSIKVIFADANLDNNRQLDQMDNFIMQGVDALVIVPVDSVGVLVGVRKAQKAGIPIISTGANFEGDDHVFIGAPDYKCGEMQGIFMEKNLPQNAKVLYLEGMPGYIHTQQRWEGFKENCLDKRPDVTLLSSQTGKYERDVGMKVTEDWIQAFPQFDAIIAANDQMALGAIQALKTNNRLKGVMITGIDGVGDALRAIKNGEMTQSILCSAEFHSQALYDVLKTIQAGGTPPKIILDPLVNVTADNIDQYYKP